MTAGTRVRLKKTLIGVPRDTEGVIDYVGPKLTWVAWNLPNRPLPAGYNEWNNFAYRLFKFRRDAFEPDEVVELLTEINS